jgi:hypothetical protein
MTPEEAAAIGAKQIARDFLHGYIGEHRLGTLMVAWLGTYGHLLPEVEENKYGRKIRSKEI